MSDEMEVTYVPTTLPWARVHRDGRIQDWVDPLHVQTCDRPVCPEPHYWTRYKDIVSRICMGKS